MKNRVNRKGKEKMGTLLQSGRQVAAMVDRKAAAERKAATLKAAAEWWNTATTLDPWKAIPTERERLPYIMATETPMRSSYLPVYLHSYKAAAERLAAERLAADRQAMYKAARRKKAVVIRKATKAEIDSIQADTRPIYSNISAPMDYSESDTYKERVEKYEVNESIQADSIAERRRFINQLIHDEINKVMYERADGREVKLVPMALRLVAGSYAMKGLRLSRPHLYNDIFDDVLQIAIMELWQADTTQEPKAIYKAVQKTIIEYIENNGTITPSKALKRCIDDEVAKSGCDRRTAKNRIIGQQHKNAILTIRKGYEPSISWAAAERLAAAVDITAERYEMIVAAAELSANDRKVLDGILFDDVSITELRRKNNRQFRRIAAAVRKVYQVSE